MQFLDLQRKAAQRQAIIDSANIPCIRVGAATCGLAAGAEAVIEAIKDEAKRQGIKIRLIRVGCIGTCYCEPIIDVTKNGKPRIFYNNVTPDVAREIVRDYLIKDRPRPDLAMGRIGDEVAGIPDLFSLPVFKNQVRIVLENAGHIDPRDIHQYIARGGFQGLKNALNMTAKKTLEEVKKSGLRGRGGAGFPTGRKWEFCRDAEGDQKYVICNADEGDPGAFMDRAVLESDPYKVLEGLVIGAYAIGASKGYIYCRAEYPIAIEMLKSAIDQMKELSLLGEKILGSDFSFDLEIFEGAGAFVCGEETSLIASIEGNDGRPRPRPPFPAQSGVYGKPTNINNVETWANISWILRNGADKFTEYGTEKSKGNKTFALTGKVHRTGLIEVPMGSTINEIVFDIGGGIPEGRTFKAVQTGGPSGGCIPATLGNTNVDYESLAELGAIMGSGGMVVMDNCDCMVDVAKYFLNFTKKESCGQCVPCREGSKQMYRIIDRISKGEGKMEDIQLLETIGKVVKDTSFCGLGQTLPNPVLTTMKYFKDEYIEHIKYKRCEAGVCPDLVYAPCQNACPLSQDVPSYISYIARKEYDTALEVIHRDNPFPRVLGRVCHHPCTSRCRNRPYPIAIRTLKRFVADRVEYPRPIKKEDDKGKKIAIVGSGPASLSAAYFLTRKGYNCTIFEKLNFAGGMLRTCIPEYRLPKNVLNEEIDWIKDIGVEIRSGIEVGKDTTIDELLAFEGYDAAFIGCGMDIGQNLRIPGETAKGVVDAITFLHYINIGQKVDFGENILVVGGGNSAIDAARACGRVCYLLNRKVRIIYRRSITEMTCLPGEVEDTIEEGLEIDFLTSPKKVLTDKNGKVTGLECLKMKLGSIDKAGRRKSSPIEGSEFVIPCDMIIVAVGQQSDPTFLKGCDGLELTQKGTIEVDFDTMQTKRKEIFAGGDIVTGPSTVVEAAADGKKAAISIERYLQGKPINPPYKVDFPKENVEVLTLSAKEQESMEAFTCLEQERLPACERCGNFREVEYVITRDQAVTEARRCLRCDIHDAGDDES